MAPTIVVVTHSRVQSLKRLLDSLSRAHYPQEAVRLIISIDFSGSNEVSRLAEDFQWNFGEKILIKHPTNLGLREHILKCGDLTKKYNQIILLEDDLFVSRSFYDYTVQALKYYSSQPQIAGVSLYTHSYNETSAMRFQPTIDEADVFFMQLPSSWGQCWTRSQWEGFRDWYCQSSSIDKQRDFLPSDVLKWPETSWKKYFIKYLIQTNKYFVYPRSSLTTNFMELGVHHKVVENRLQVPLLASDKKFIFKDLDQSFCIYDAWCEMTVESLKKICPEVINYHFCVDLYGTKNIEFINSEYLLTSKECREPLIKYGLHLRPHEQNLIHGIAGDVFSLVKTENVTSKESKLTKVEQITYYYSLPRSFPFQWMKSSTKPMINGFLGKMVRTLKKIAALS